MNTYSLRSYLNFNSIQYKYDVDSIELKNMINELTKFYGCCIVEIDNDNMYIRNKASSINIVERGSWLIFDAQKNMSVMSDADFRKFFDVDIYRWIEWNPKYIQLNTANNYSYCPVSKTYIDIERVDGSTSYHVLSNICYFGPGDNRIVRYRISRPLKDI